LFISEQQMERNFLQRMSKNNQHAKLYDVMTYFMTKMYVNPSS